MADLNELEHVVHRLTMRYHPMEQATFTCLALVLSEFIGAAPDPEAKALTLRQKLTGAIDATRVRGPNANSAEQAQVQDAAVQTAGAMIDFAKVLAQKRS